MINISIGRFSSLLSFSLMAADSWEAKVRKGGVAPEKQLGKMGLACILSSLCCDLMERGFLYFQQGTSYAPPLLGRVGQDTAWIFALTFIFDRIRQFDSQNPASNLQTTAQQSSLQQTNDKSSVPVRA